MILDYLKFFFTGVLVFILPGFSLLYLLIRSRFKFLKTELLVFSCALSIVIINFLVLLLDKLNYSLSASHLINLILLLIALPLVVSTFPGIKKSKHETAESKKSFRIPKSLALRRRQFLILSILVFACLFISTKFLAQDIVPNNTDLGHHMYWVKLMAEEQKIPDYTTSDVIIGEHIPFAIISIISGVGVMSAFPVIFSMFIIMLSFLAVYNLALRIFQNQNIAIVAFAFCGFLYVISAPMMKFASGGVVGNVFGNLFIPSVLLLFYLSYQKRNSFLLALAVFLSIGLFFIHHLSTLLLAFILIFVFLIQLILDSYFDNQTKGLKPLPTLVKWIKLLFSPACLAVFLIFAVILIFVYTPHYIREQAVETVVKDPIKDSHQGVSLNSFISSVGEWRTVLGVLGLLSFAFFAFKKLFFVKQGMKNFSKLSQATKNRVIQVKENFNSLTVAIILGWILILLILSFWPNLLKIDLPSRRVVNYLIQPFCIICGYFLIKLLLDFKKRLNQKMFKLVALVLLTSLCLNGFSDSMVYFRDQNQFAQTVQTYHAAEYLKKSTNKNTVILKDHANLTADSWLKVFFLRGYDYCLSRTFDYKYEDPTSDRDPCPFYMAIAPDSSAGLECYKKTEVKYIILAKGYDNFFFEHSFNFSKVYVSDSVVIYKRKG
ncbi:MAG: hypothetical protein GF335_04700 [Candidatus Moranbacteria bacterium]|nr:hypothetical protein [Candidatus Moranbacteria bacterium]